MGKTIKNCQHQLIIASEAGYGAKCSECHKPFTQEQIIALIDTQAYNQKIIFLRDPDTSDYDMTVALEGIE